jgi:hypothetical protein
MPDVPEDDIIEQTLLFHAENMANAEQQRRAEDKAKQDRLEMEARYGSR